MAVFYQDKKGCWVLQFEDAYGQRKSIRLGKMDKRTAESAKLQIEKLISAYLAGVAPPRETALWLSSVGAPFYDRLVRAGLVPPKHRFTVGQWLQRWLQRKKAEGYKPASLVAWGLVVAELDRLFGDMGLEKFSHKEAEGYREAMQSRGLRPSTIQKRIQHAKYMFEDARRQGILERNPFEAIRVRGGNPAERRCYVPVEDALKVIDAFASVHWRLLIALGRFAGLRIPSEALSLRWEDVDWEGNRLIVPCPKTEKQGKPYRVVPLFPLLRPFLEAAWEAAPEGAIWVFPEEWRKRAQGPGGWRNANFRSVLAKAIRRAGLQPWPRLWHNLRASCETDLAAEFPLAVVTRWLGNTPTIAMRHYVDVTDEMIEKGSKWTPKALQGALWFGAETDCAALQPPKSGSLQVIDTQRLTTFCNATHPPKVEVMGVEPTTSALRTLRSPN